MTSEDEFLKALQGVSTVAPRSIEYRVYYDPGTGVITHYSNDEINEPYIIVDKKIWHNARYDWKVKNGKLVPPVSPVGKLTPGQEGTPCDPEDITIIAYDVSRAKYWSMQTHED